MNIKKIRARREAVKELGIINDPDYIMAKRAIEAKFPDSKSRELYIEALLEEFKEQGVVSGQGGGYYIIIQNHHPVFMKKQDKIKLKQYKSLKRRFKNELNRNILKGSKDYEVIETLFKRLFTFTENYRKEKNERESGNGK